MAYDENLARRVRTVTSDWPALEEKKMFGGVGYLINGNMACGVNGDRVIVRMSDDDATEALTEPHVRVFDLPGRPMKGWITVGPEGVASDAQLKSWVERGLKFASKLPPKK